MLMRHFFNPAGFGTEIIYTIVILVVCFLIYQKTKESYDLTKHRGIKYFRQAFLFLGLSYAFRLFFSLMMLSNIAFDFFIPRRELIPLLIIPFGYLSTMAIFYLALSPLWKKFDKKHILLFGHGIAVLLAVISFITRSHIILLYLQSFLLLVAVILIFIMHKKSKKTYTLKVLYILLFVFWLINLWVIRPRPFIAFEIKILFQLISLAVFFGIYYKVSKWLR